MTEDRARPVEVHRLAAFTDDPIGGNPAGVAFVSDLDDGAAMQQVAAEIGYSETVFLAEKGSRRYRTRYFSPKAEVDFCGHATIAAAVLLGRLRGAGVYPFETNSGEVAVAASASADGGWRGTLTSVEPRQRPLPDDVLRVLLEIFGWDNLDLDPAIPPLEAFAGAWHPVLALRSRAALARMSYDFDRLRDLMLERRLTTVQVIYRERPDLVWARNPFPVGGVVEDAATGASAAALGGYFRGAGLIAVPGRFEIRQGHDIGRPSRIEVEVPARGGIRVSGTAVELESDDR